MNFEVGCRTDIGLKKANNEDSFFFSEKAGLFVVADGMGGHAGGEVASEMAIKRLSSDLAENAIPVEKLAAAIEESVNAAGRDIKSAAAENQELAGMGTTVVMCVCRDDAVKVVNVGDSRCYRLAANGEFSLVSRDHSQIQEYIDMNLITEAQAKVHPMRHVITQAVGYNDALSVRIVELPAAAGDAYLLCSDGLNDHFESDEELGGLVKGLMTERAGDLGSVCGALVTEANRRGGRDNVTVMIFRITSL